MKKFLSMVLMTTLLCTMIFQVPVLAAEEAMVTMVTMVDDANKFADLEGNWNFKTYRTYDQMFQYFFYYPSDMTLIPHVVWEDLETALLPEYSEWNTWEQVTIPSDDVATKGLLPIVRDDGSAFFPSWSEAWLTRNVEIPLDFTTEETVTLLLGTIDDVDVVYINGQLVEASGFIDGEGNKTLDIPEVGGFDYAESDVTKQVKFETSYWEVQREYTIPTDVLKLGETNEISIRLFNNNGFGGFYAGNPMAICGNDLAVRTVKGLPTQVVDSILLTDVVDEQIEALSAGDIERFGMTINDDYNNDGMTKEDRLEQVQAYIDMYSNINITDEKIGTYIDDENKYWYSAIRTMTGINKESKEKETILSKETIEVSYAMMNGIMYEYGNWSRCFPVSYGSELFGKDLSYSIYLPPNYWENSSKEYPVVYLLHGINSSSNSFVNVDQIDLNMDQWILAGELTDMIVVMPDSGKNAFYRDSPLDPTKADSTGAWQTQLAMEMRHEIDMNYRTLSDSMFRGLTGISMGGYGAMTVGTTYKSLYSSIASHMGALSTQALDSLKSLTPEQLEKYDFYVDCGLQDTMVDYQGTVNVHDYLDSMGIEHGFDLRDGGHNSAFYMAGMLDSMKMHSDHFMDNGLFTFDTMSIEEKADYLKEEGFFVGSDKGFELDREPTKVEAAVMLVRLLGKETEALTKQYTSPFTDVPVWAEDYVGYLYQMGLVMGINDQTFGASERAIIDDYATFILRVLGYNDTRGDFSYETAMESAVSKGIISEDYMEMDVFLRKDMVEMSYNALNSMINKSDQTLKEFLAEEKVME